MSAPLVIGVDVGGTKILSGVVDRSGEILSRHLIESPGTSEADVLDAIDASVEAVLDDRVGAIGIGVPANLARGTGRVLRATNLPFDDFDLAAHGRGRFGMPVGVENDGNAAALAEWRLGAGRGTSNLVMLTLGTGVGGGFVLDGRLYRGWAEVGHMVIVAGGPPCQGNCHGRGHLEAVASGSAGDRAAQELWGGDTDAYTLIERGKEGDEDALRSLHEITGYVGAAIGSLANLFDPEVVVIGGGFGEGVDLLMGHIQETARREALAPIDSTLKIVSAELGADAGLVGAALVGFEALDGAW